VPADADPAFNWNVGKGYTKAAGQNFAEAKKNYEAAAERNRAAENGIDIKIREIAGKKISGEEETVELGNMIPEKASRDKKDVFTVRGDVFGIGITTAKAISRLKADIVPENAGYAGGLKTVTTVSCGSPRLSCTSWTNRKWNATK
jgi:hypothetical protein